MEEAKLTGMVVADLKRELAEKDKEIESLKKKNKDLEERNKEAEGMLEIATRELREIKAAKSGGV